MENRVASNGLTKFIWLFLAVYVANYVCFLSHIALFPQGGAPTWLPKADNSLGSALQVLSLAVFYMSGVGFLRPRRIWLSIALFPMVTTLLSAIVLIWTLGEISIVDTFDLGLRPPALATATTTSLVFCWVVGLLGIGIGIAAAVFSWQGEWSVIKAKADSIKAFSLIYGLVAVVFLPLLLIYTVTALVTGVTHGFLKIRGLDISSEQRTYVRGPITVVLVPMAHIGKSEFYRTILADFNTPDTVMIYEGVSDHKKLLKHKPAYKQIAMNLGLSDQGTEFQFQEQRQMAIQHGDLDVSEFQPSSIKALNELFEMMADGNSKLTALRSGDEKQFVNMLRDILDKRNEHLISVLDEMIKKKIRPRILIPWGALHMIAMEEALLKWDFQLTDRKIRHVGSIKILGAKMPKTPEQSLSKSSTN